MDIVRSAAKSDRLTPSEQFICRFQVKILLPTYTMEDS